MNNSVGFPGILKGALLVRASKITDNMAITAARSLASFAEKRGISPNYIIPTMDEAAVFPHEAADVAMQAVRDGVARVILDRDVVYKNAEADIAYSRKLLESMISGGFLSPPPLSMIEQTLVSVVADLRSGCGK